MEIQIKNYKNIKKDTNGYNIIYILHLIKTTYITYMSQHATAYTTTEPTPELPTSNKSKIYHYYHISPQSVHLLPMTGQIAKTNETSPNSILPTASLKHFDRPHKPQAISESQYVLISTSYKRTSTHPMEQQPYQKSNLLMEPHSANYYRVSLDLHISNQDLANQRIYNIITQHMSRTPSTPTSRVTDYQTQHNSPPLSHKHQKHSYTHRVRQYIPSHTATHPVRQYGGEGPTIRFTSLETI